MWSINLAMPDGRVIICGGSLLELMPGGKYGARNMTKCWFWIHRTDKIEPLEFLSKLPFNWLGPFLPNLMQLVRFEKKNEMNNEEKPKHQENITATNIKLSAMNRNEYYRQDSCLKKIGLVRFLSDRVLSRLIILAFFPL